MNFEMLLCTRLCALRFVLVCALTFVLSDVCSHVLSYVLPYALICVLSFVLVNLHSHICALVCILSYLCSHLCAPSFLPRDAMFHLFLFTLFGVPCRCNFLRVQILRVMRLIHELMPQLSRGLQGASKWLTDPGKSFLILLFMVDLD